MPSHLISDAQEWIDEILSAKPLPRERKHQRGKKMFSRGKKISYSREFVVYVSCFFNSVAVFYRKIVQSWLFHRNNIVFLKRFTAAYISKLIEIGPIRCTGLYFGKMLQYCYAINNYIGWFIGAVFYFLRGLYSWIVFETGSAEPYKVDFWKVLYLCSWEVNFVFDN